MSRTVNTPQKKKDAKGNGGKKRASERRESNIVLVWPSLLIALILFLPSLSTIVHTPISGSCSFVLSFILHIILWCYTHTHVPLQAKVRLYNYNSVVTVIISMFTSNVRQCQRKRAWSIQKNNERKRSDVEEILRLLLSLSLVLIKV